MRQLFQDLKTGEISAPELPRPNLGSKQVLVRTVYSLVSPGTERMLLEFGKGSWLSKAKQQPDKVKEVIQKIKTDGISPTVKAVFNKLNQPLPLGYSNVGVVEEVGSEVMGIRPGMRVLSNGPHAELALVPASLCIRIPDNVTDEDAAFGILASIAMQGNRLVKPELGETVAVIGLGLLGLISVQLLLANGCKVLAFDLNAERVGLAGKLGASAYVIGEDCNPVQIAHEATAGHGADAVLICAATSSNQPIELAPQMCRKRGRVVLVGVVGLNLSRKDFYEKEISFQVSCSYGPGRYDALYEQKGLDYPIGFVRWTEERNIAAVLDLLSQNKLSFKEYVTQRVQFSKACSAYAELIQDGSQLGILFEYDQHKKDQLASRSVKLAERKSGTDALKVSFIGAGGHARAALLPAFKAAGVEFQDICSKTGAASQKIAVDYGFASNTTDIEQVLNDNQTDIVVISTRHDSHADLTARAIAAKKNVFVEKPLAISVEQLKAVEASLKLNPEAKLAVGFNRRFAPCTLAIKERLRARKSSVAVVITVNAGAIPATNWNNDAAEGGGRIIGEACHFVDLAQAIVQSPIEKVFCQALCLDGDMVLNNAVISLEFLDGSVASIQYLCNGSKKFPKEKVQVFSSGNIYEIENFNKLKGLGASQNLKNALRGQDKGHNACVKDFVDSIGKAESNNDLYLHVSLACLAVIESARRNRAISMEEFSAEFSAEQAEYFETERLKVHSV